MNVQNPRLRQPPSGRSAQPAQVDARPLSDAEQIALSAMAGAFSGFLIWLYWIVIHFAWYVTH